VRKDHEVSADEGRALIAVSPAASLVSIIYRKADVVSWLESRRRKAEAQVHQ
jgi:hypothetical protein